MVGFLHPIALSALRRGCWEETKEADQQEVTSRETKEADQSKEVRNDMKRPRSRGPLEQKLRRFEGNHRDLQLSQCAY